jgi:hypothetical protein
MIHPIHWPRLGSESPPFDRNGRALRVTVHAPSTYPPSADERHVPELLRELGFSEFLDIADTDPLAPRHIQVGSQPNKNGLVAVTILENGEPTRFMGLHPQDWIHTAIRMIGIGGANDPRTLELAAHLPSLEAHRQNYRNIFATTVPDLLALRGRQTGKGNVRTLREALKIIGLYLRAKGDYTYHWFANGRSAGFDRGLFYWVLARYRTPMLWPYFAACLRRGSTLRDHTDHLGNGILTLEPYAPCRPATKSETSSIDGRTTPLVTRCCITLII